MYSPGVRSSMQEPVTPRVVSEVESQRSSSRSARLRARIPLVRYTPGIFWRRTALARDTPGGRAMIRVPVPAPM